MKKILNVLMFMSVFLLLGTVGFSDEEESKYRKDFVVDKNVKIEIPKSTEGNIEYSLAKGIYVIEIYSEDKASTMHLDDVIRTKFSDKKAILPKQIREGYYKFIVVNKRNAKYKHFYKTTLTKGKLRIKITKQK